MKFHLVISRLPVFLLRPQKHHRDENEWRQAQQQFFESLPRGAKPRSGDRIVQESDHSDGKRIPGRPPRKQIVVNKPQFVNDLLTALDKIEAL